MVGEHLIYVVVHHPWFKLYFSLFWGMVMYDNDMIISLRQGKIKFKARIKLNHSIAPFLLLKSFYMEMGNRR